MKYVRNIIIILLVVFSVSFLALFALDELRMAYPTTFLCGKVIEQPDDAIKTAAQSIVAWPKEPLSGLTPTEYVRNPGICCSASLSKSFPGTWDVSITLPTECGTAEEYVYVVRTCGGGVSRIGSAPSRSGSTIISSTLSPKMPSDSNTRKYCR